MEPMSRRFFLEKVGLASAVATGSRAAPTGSHAARSKASPGKKEDHTPEGNIRYAIARCVTESTFSSGKTYAGLSTTLSLT